MAPHLSKFGMKAEVVESVDFLHPYHLQAIPEQGIENSNYNYPNHHDDYRDQSASTQIYNHSKSYSFENLESITLIKIFSTTV